MSRPSKESKLHAIHELAMQEYKAIQSALRDERVQCLQDRRFAFVAGAQWEGPLGMQFANKPKFEVNKVALAIDQIEIDYRNNAIAAEFIAKDGSTDDGLPDACAALHRADEQDSVAEEAYNNAFEEAVAGGFGAWRLRAERECEEGGEYEYDDEDEDDDSSPSDSSSSRQRIRIEPIFDADSSVFFDLDAKRQDKSDARVCFIVSSLTREEYARRYPDDDVATWEKLIHQREHDWLTPDVIYIAEYFVVETTHETVYTYRDAVDNEQIFAESELDEETLRTLENTGFQRVRTRRATRRRVHKYILNGNSIMEDCGYIAGREIPVVPVYGKHLFVDNVERCRGHTRLAKDSQRVKNMGLSRLAEINAYSTIEKPIVAPEQIKGHQMSWAQDNTEPLPFLMLNPLTDASGQIVSAGPVGYTKSPSVPQALGALLQVADTDMKEILGNSDQAEKMVSHVAGKTAEAIQQRVDLKSYIYISNMGKAIRRSAQIWLSMARTLYTQRGRDMKGIGPRKEVRKIELQKPVMDKKNGRITLANDMSRAAFDVVVTIGPSSISKREAALQKCFQMMATTQDPETQAVLNNFALLQMEGEGIEDIRAWSRSKLVKQGVLKPTPEEAQALAEEAKNAKPSPNDQFLLAAAEEARAKAQNVMHEAAKTVAQTDKVKADTIVALAGVDLDRRKAAVDAAKSVHEMLTTPMPPAPGTQGEGQ